MYNPWIVYGGIILGTIVYTAIVGYIFWHIGFNRGYDQGVYETKKFFKKNRHSKWNHQYDTGVGSVRVLPPQDNQSVWYLDRGIR